MACLHREQSDLQQLDDAAVGQLPPKIEEAAPPLVAIVAYESPTSLRATVDFDAHGATSKPLRPLGRLTRFALARAAIRLLRDRATGKRRRKRHGGI